jgi:uncharacterized SAM-binding protein YcdF (DUF218 family)
LSRRAAVLLGALVAWFIGVAALILWSEPGPSAASADVAVVLGAAIRADGAPSPVFQGRIEQGVALFRAGRVRRLLFTGGRGEGATLSEAAAARRWAVERGVPPGAILVEERSRTTRQNLLESRAVMQRERLRTALIVSDPLHLPRAMRMAADVGLSAQAAPTPTTRYRTARSRLPFLARESFFLTTYWLTGD